MHYGKPTDDSNDANHKYVHGGINKNTGQEWLPQDKCMVKIRFLTIN